jgi:hypothetical protein
MYKLFNSEFDGKPCMVLRIADNTYIPFDPANTDYAAYLAWVALGNTPQPADEVTK